MATVTRPHRPLPLPTASATPAPTEPPADSPLDPPPAHLGDRVAFVVWVTCGLFMAALLTYDTVMGLLR